MTGQRMRVIDVATQGVELDFDSAAGKGHPTPVNARTSPDGPPMWKVTVAN